MINMINMSLVLSTFGGKMLKMLIMLIMLISLSSKSG